MALVAAVEVAAGWAEGCGVYGVEVKWLGGGMIVPRGRRFGDAFNRISDSLRPPSRPFKQPMEDLYAIG
jgi:hypothetical protein